MDIQSQNANIFLKFPITVSKKKSFRGLLRVNREPILTGSEWVKRCASKTKWKKRSLAPMNDSL